MRIRSAASVSVTAIMLLCSCATAEQRGHPGAKSAETSKRWSPVNAPRSSSPPYNGLTLEQIRSKLVGFAADCGEANPSNGLFLPVDIQQAENALFGSASGLDSSAAASEPPLDTRGVAAIAHGEFVCGGLPVPQGQPVARGTDIVIIINSSDAIVDESVDVTPAKLILLGTPMPIRLEA